jgi:hypothetical protein
LLLSAEVAAIAEIAAAGVQAKSLFTVIRTLPALRDGRFGWSAIERQAATAFDLRASSLSLRFQI